MIEPALAFAVDVEPGKDIGRPEQRVAAMECLLIHVPDWDVKAVEITEAEDLSREQWPRQWHQQSDAADAHRERQQAPDAVHGADGLRNARINSPRRIYRVASCA